jgi:type I restriction enzyme S subunit
MKWPTAQLGAVTKIVSGSTPKSGNPAFWGGSIPWATPTDLSGLTTKELTSTGRQITEAGFASCSANMLPARSVLFSSRAPIGLVAINKQPLCTNQGFKSFVPDASRLSPDFLFWWLKGNRPALEHLGRGATFKEVSKSIIEKVEIPLPPLAEQKRIAAILDAADALRTKRRESLAQLDALLQSTFLTLFGECDRPPVSLGKPTFGTTANFVPLSSVATMATGHTPDRSRSEYWNGNIPWISLTEIRDFNGRIATETRENVSEEGIKNSSSVKLPKGTVCFSRTASVGFVTVMGREMSTSQDFVNWVCGPKIDPIYLMWCLIFSRDYLLSKSAGSIHKTIYHRHTERFQVYLPPLPLQQKFAAIVESVERQKAAQRAHLAELDALFAALQHRAFRGEL